MRFLEPFELCLEKVEPFHVSDDRGLSRFMSSFEICRGKGAAQAMAGDHFIHPSEALEMVPVELPRLWCAHRGQNALRIAAEGVVTVIDADSAKLNVLATNKLDGAILATPALAAGNIYVRTESHLYSFGM